ncbi:MAG TPA: RNA 2',3'-cyclic phosphodiesterase [Candidatus Limnocylindrales bacterium]|nr:RNA 2',3'-cyclic phosphodiesterase [Candidatus Limnocylindrales bacterium]
MSGPLRHRAPRGDPYAGIPGRRLFVGVPLPQDATAAVAEVVERVRATTLAPGARDVRWVRLDGLHLTIRFLGPTPTERIDPTAEAVLQVARAFRGPIDVELGRAGTFPSGRRPRALWIGLTEGAETLTELALAMEAALADVGWPPVDRPFRPHLTLARSDGVASGALVGDRLVAVMADRRIRFRVDRVGLYESVTGGGPARYVPVMLGGLGETPADGSSVYNPTTPDPL